MAAENFTFSNAKGRTVEYYNRVDNADPVNCALIFVPCSVAGTEAQGQGFDDLAAVLGDANWTEQVGSTWSRFVMKDAELVELPAASATQYAVAVPAKTWTAVASSNDTAGALICYDPDTTAGTDANIIPLTAHIFAVTTDGNDVILNAGNFIVCS